MNKMDIYNNSPIFIQNILTSLEGKRRKKIRFGKYYHHYLNYFKNFDYTDRALIEKTANFRFLELVNYAYNNSKFYNNFYQFDISKIKSIDDIGLLPILEKDEVRKNLSDIYTIPLSKECHTSKTGGTTGSSISFRHTLENYQTRLAYLDAFKEKHGFLNIKMKRASFNSSKIVPPFQKSKIFWRDNKPLNQRLYSTHRCFGENLHYYIEDLNKFKPDSIDGYTFSIHSVAKYIINNGINLSFTPKAIFTTSETLYPHFRKDIEKAFGCKVYDQYSSSEGATFITECKCGNLHIGEDTGIIETDSNGDILITSFFSFGTPLIRYRIGDRAILADSDFVCPCGSKLKTVKRLEGRTKDFLLKQNGDKIFSIHLESSIDIFDNEVKALQFVQNEVGLVHVNIETNNGYTSHCEKLIQNELSYKFGDRTVFIFHYPQHIEKAQNGKFKFIINNIKL